MQWFVFVGGRGAFGKLYGTISAQQVLLRIMFSRPFETLTFKIEICETRHRKIMNLESHHLNKKIFIPELENKVIMCMKAITNLRVNIFKVCCAIVCLLILLFTFAKASSKVLYIPLRTYVINDMHKGVLFGKFCALPRIFCRPLSERFPSETRRR
jgi:energy-converting hydrogenase Eha subunit C